MARLLPCDPQARTAIDEVSRASDARLVALTNYWTLASLQSRTQIEPIRRLLAQEEDRASDWTADANQVQVDAALTAARGASLAMSVPQLPAMANPQKILQDIAGQYRSLEKQAQERAGGESRLLVDLRELLNTSQARQAAIDQRMKTVAAEGQRWSAYYAARQARAQVECSLINSAAGTGPAAVPRPTPQRKKP